MPARRAKTGQKSRRKAGAAVHTEVRHVRAKRKVKSRTPLVAVGLRKPRAKGAKLPGKRAAKKK
jgi:hypothetical protein